MAKLLPNQSSFNQLTAILNDLIFKAGYNVNNPNDIKNLKLLKAREENIDFELELAERICGDNPNYPYRSSYYLTKFFQDLGFHYMHSGITRRHWVEDVLKELTILEIAKVIETGLFRKKDFSNSKLRRGGNANCSDSEFLQLAIQDFKAFIDRSITANESINLLEILDLNINLELLFENKATTDDEELNKLIDEAKSRFLNPKDKHIALEKIWDAFERIKTYYESGKQKSKSADQLIEKISSNFNKELFEEEFKKLTSIGNNYRIRHHETDKLEITDPKHINYLFFRMLTLIDLCLVKLKE